MTVCTKRKTVRAFFVVRKRHKSYMIRMNKMLAESFCVCCHSAEHKSLPNRLKLLSVFLSLNFFAPKQQQHQGSISPMFYEQLYACRSQKRNNTVKLSIFFVISGSARVKSAHKTMMKLTPLVKKEREIEKEV